MKRVTPITAIDTAIRHTTPAGGNVFADLGFPADEAAKRLRVTRPHVSDVVTDKTEKFAIVASPRRSGLFSACLVGCF